MWANGDVRNVVPAGAGQLGRRRVVGAHVLAVLGTVVLTSVLKQVGSSGSLSFEAMVFLAFVVGCALLGGRWPAVVAALLAGLCLNYWFTEPLHELRIASAENVATIVIFLVVALAVSGLVDRAARGAHQARVARAEADNLALLNRSALVLDDVPQLLAVVAELFGFDAATLEPPGSVGNGTRFTLPDGWSLTVRGRRPDDAERRVLTAFAGHLGLLRERAELTRQADAARELELGNRVRTALLAAVSHDVRTPLAALKVAVSTLRTPGVTWAEEDRAELLATTEEATDRLIAIIADLLDMTRLQSGGITLAREDVAVDDLLARAAAVERPVAVVADDQLPSVHVDVGLTDRVLANLTANAVRHGGGAPVELVARSVDHSVEVRVVDHGPGVPDHLKTRMFAPFERLGAAPRGDGVGLGLTVAQGLAEAQGTTIRAEDTPGGGLTMVLTLPASPTAGPEVDDGAAP
jgi:two-component system sensor histidine kinase KdpD